MTVPWIEHWIDYNHLRLNDLTQGNFLQNGISPPGCGDQCHLLNLPDELDLQMKLDGSTQNKRATEKYLLLSHETWKTADFETFV